MIHCIQNRIVRCRSGQNSFSPFNKLPQEIASMILLESVEEGFDYYMELMTLRSVCQSWKALIDETPHFWGYLFFDDCPELIDQIVRRSRGVPLDVRSGDGYGRYDPLRRLASEHLPLRSFQFDETRQLKEDESEDLKILLQRPAPRITNLELFMDPDEEDVVFIVENLFGGEAPNLQTVVVQYAAIRWEGLTLPKLQSLKLEGVRSPYEFTLSFPSFLHALHNSPNLETLFITAMVFRDEAQEPASTPITLASLKTVHLAEIPAQIANKIFQRMDLPTCNDLKVSCSLDPTSSVDVAGLIGTVMALMRSSQEIVVSVPYGTYLQVKGEGWAVKTGHMARLDPTVSVFRDLFINSIPLVARRAVSEFQISLWLSNALETLLPILHLAFPALSTLAVDPFPGFNLDLLTSPTTMEGWLLPNLRTFHYEMGFRFSHPTGVAELSPAVRVAEARRNAQTTGLAPAPAPLTTFKAFACINPYLRGAGKELFERLEAVFENVEYASESERAFPEDGGGNLIFA